MPYFLVCEDTVLTLSADLKTALLYQDTIISETYQRIFNSFIVSCKPLLKTSASLHDLLQYYQHAFTDLHNEDLFCIEPQPCLMHYVTPEIAASLLIEKGEHGIAFLHDLAEYHKKLSSVHTKRISLFTEEGFRTFISDGRIAYLPADLMRPPNRSERSMILQQIIHDIKEGTNDIRLINNTKLKVPNSTIINVLSGKQINITGGTLENLQYSNTVHIDELGIVNAFEDFITNILETEMVNSKENTLAVLEKGHQTLNSM